MYPGGAKAARQAIATITTFPYKIRQRNVHYFPEYSDDPAAYEAARLAVALFIEAQPQ